MNYISIIKIATELIQLIPNLSKIFKKSVVKNPKESMLFLAKIAEIAKNITGEKTANKILNNIKSNPDKLSHFEEIITQMNIEMKKNVISFISEDRKNARYRDVEIHKLGHKNTKSYIMLFISVIGIIACPSYLIWIMSQNEDLPREIIAIISTIITIFGTCLKDCYSFEFGQSYKNHFFKKNNIVDDDDVKQKSQNKNLKYQIIRKNFQNISKKCIKICKRIF